MFLQLRQQLKHNRFRQHFQVQFLQKMKKKIKFRLLNLQSDNKNLK